jgi:hypothetical protein
VRTPVLRAPFLLSATFVAALCALVLRSSLFARNPEIAAWGVTFDLTITIPLLYWFFAVRTKKAPPMTLAPPFVICTLIASAVAPSPFARDLGRFAVPLAEIALVGAIVHRIRQRRGENAIRAVLGNGRIAEVVESELQMLYFAFCGWRKKPSDGFTFHERSGWGAILAGILLLIVAEGIGMHLLFGMWSPYAAWGWTMLDVWGVIWLLGDYQALRLRRSTVDGDALRIRLGLRWAIDVPLASIAAIESIESQAQWKRRDVLKVAILDEPPCASRSWRKDWPVCAKRFARWRCCRMTSR